MSTEARQACGRRLRDAREGMKLTQAQLASKVPVSQPSLHEWETGTSLPTFENRLRLAEVLGFDPFAVQPQPSAQPAGEAVA